MQIERNVILKTNMPKHGRIPIAVHVVLFGDVFTELRIGLTIHSQQILTHLQQNPKCSNAGTETCYFILVLQGLNNLNF